MIWHLIIDDSTTNICFILNRSLTSDMSQSSEALRRQDLCQTQRHSRQEMKIILAGLAYLYTIM